MKPREKMLKHGPENLESWELIATILGSGIKGQPVFRLAKKVDKFVQELGDKITMDDLLKIKGIGKVKAIQIISAFEVAKRHFVQDSTLIESVQDVLREVTEYRNKKQEHLLCLTLDGANRLINTHLVTIGLLTQSLIHPREIFSLAIEDRANSIILVHNHPSGIAQPSNEDINITDRIREVSRLVGIQLRDHVIVTKKEYYSFSEDGLV